MIQVHNCGYDSKHHSILDMKVPNGYEDDTLLFIKSNAFFESDGKVIDLKPNTVILYEKHTYIHYGCHSCHYNDDWIHFDLTKEDTDLLTQLDLPRNTPVPMDYIGNLTQYAMQIVMEKFSDHIHKEKVIDALMHALLYSLASQVQIQSDMKSDQKYYQLLSSMRTSILNAPYKHWSIDSIAETVHLSTSHFQRLYKSFFGSSCMQELIQARIKNAQFYLRTTEMSIQSLSEYCGYDNELHFMRQFKQYTGLTPSQYRRITP